MIREEVVIRQRDLVSVWLVYQKAYDFVPHDWIAEFLTLAKVPQQLIFAIQALSSTWATQLYSYSYTEAGTVRYCREILQGDSLPLLIFIFALNPLSRMLKKCDGYYIGPLAEALT